MRWPTWTLIGLSIICIGLGIWDNSLTGNSGLGDQRMALLSFPMLIGGFILLAAGLTSLQRTYDNWDCCGDYCSPGGGCDCGHCEGCKGDDCCGQCQCSEVSESHEGHSHGDEGHEGHSH